MQIESQTCIGLENNYIPKRPHRAKGKIVDTILKIPVRVFRYLPFLTAPARREARSISITKMELALSQLPIPFDGLRLAFLTDFHSGPTTPASFLKRVIDATNELKPDLVLLGGDYINRQLSYLPEIGAVLGNLHAPLGVYGVLGNHDYWMDPDQVHCMLEDAGIVDVTNAGRWLQRDGSRIRIAGVGDLWEDEIDLPRALDGAKEMDAVILLSHNPDYVMEMHDRRVKLVLSGHTHGGQICLPVYGPIITNSRYGRRVVSGLVPFDSFQVYTSRGLGTVVAPLRYNCPPEIALFTLRPKD